MHQSYDETMNMPVTWRRMLLDKFVEQKEKENKAMEDAQRKAKQKR